MKRGRQKFAPARCCRCGRFMRRLGDARLRGCSMCGAVEVHLDGSIEAAHLLCVFLPLVAQ